MTLQGVMESGWRECDLEDCDYITIPGTPLRLPIQKGFAEVMQAFLRDLHECVESCLNARGISDEGSWTQDNSVYTSNHKAAVAVDWNWEDHPMGPDAIAGDCAAGWCGSSIIPGNQVPAVLELLQWYTFEGLAMVKWGATWTSPKDSMHFQAGYGTAQDPAKVQRFIQQRIRADGYSTYRRGGVPRGGGVAVPPTVVQGGLTAAVLAQIMDHRVPQARYDALYERFMSALALADCTTVRRRAFFVGQVGHESGGLKYQEEIASGEAYNGRADLGNVQPGDGPRYKGRDFVQITGRTNYTSLSAWAYSVGQVPTPTWFVDHPESLATDKYAFLGVVWYWIRARNMNRYADADDFVGATRAVNGGTNGLADRQAFLARALAVGDDLLDPAPTTTDEWEQLMADETKSQSRSIYRTDNGLNFTARDMVFNADATTHSQMVEAAALRGEPWAVTLVADVAAGVGVGARTWWDKNQIDTWAVAHAQLVLKTIESTNPNALSAYLEGKA